MGTSTNTADETDPAADRHASTTATTSAGPVSLPIQYRDGLAATALYQVEIEQARQLLGDQRLKPVERDGQATTTLTFYDYRDTSIGPYREVSLALLVALADGTGNESMGFRILDLPVTTAIAEAAGREIWGYPKFQAEIQVESRISGFLGLLQDPSGETICQLSGQPGERIREAVEGHDVVTYSSGLSGDTVRRHVKPPGEGGPESHARSSRPPGERLLATQIDVDCCYDVFAPGTLSLELGSSPHPMAARLRELGLHQRKPARWQVSDNFRAQLGAGQVVVAC
ncbi:MAG: hypothetical protein DWQ35_08350 [Planctomycetota bacterium]|nr:MAG: hypothetical protein DWQ35_08350 [Planctomycetota bacterium]